MTGLLGESYHGARIKVVPATAIPRYSPATPGRDRPAQATFRPPRPPSVMIPAVTVLALLTVLVAYDNADDGRY